jgi:hypothetical protein
MGIEYFMVRDIASQATRRHDFESSHCSKCHKRTGYLINYMCEECYDNIMRNKDWLKKEPKY